MKFQSLKANKHFLSRLCTVQTTHAGKTRGAGYVGTWLGWPMGDFCPACKTEWEKMFDEFR